jgi:predicted ester cyclase
VTNTDIATANKQVVRECFHAIDAHEFDRLRDFWHEDMVCHMIGTPEPMNGDATVEFIREAYSIFPDFTHELHEVIAEAENVVVRLTNHTTHQNEFEGLPPSGNRVDYTSFHLVKFADGLIKEWWLLEDNLTFLMQLGMKLVPGDGAS